MDIQLWSDLITKGYFPEELPPSFKTEGLSKLISVSYLLPACKKSGKILPYSIPRIKGYRRQLGIPCAHQFLCLSKSIIESWDQLKLHFRKSEISIFDFETEESDTRFLPKPDFDELHEKRIIQSTGYRYLLIIDITRFYHSIYTHIIPWALHTKVISKSDKSDSLLGNVLDTFCRRIQDNQTMGIPIGPDTSRIISEIIMVAIDEILQKILPSFSGIRNVDDYYLYFKSLGDCEKAKSIIQRTLKDFELELNSSKEKTVELPEIMESDWFSDIRSFRFRKAEKQQRFDITAFFDKSFFYARKYPDELILTYSIAKLRSVRIHRINWEIFQSYLLNSLTLESKVIWLVIFELLKYHDLNKKSILDGDEEIYPFNWNLISQSIDEFIMFHATLDNHYEILWCLWLYGEIGLVMNKKLSAMLNNTNHPLIILSMLYLEKKHLLKHKLNKTEWITKLTEEELNTENWLLAYEASVGKWLMADFTYVKQHSFYGTLLKKKIQFFQPDNSYKTEQYFVSGPRPSLTVMMNSGELSSNSDL